MKEKVRLFIDGIADSLIQISRKIHENPELSFKEFQASRFLTNELENSGFEVELGIAGLETAIRAIHPSKSVGPKVAFLGEYDALPEIGHGCGHNLMAAASLGAALAVGKIKTELPGTLIFFGTPAEEEGGGKIIMTQAGLFNNLDAVMIFHPSSSYTMVGRGSLALTEIQIEFSGKAAHASASPEKGINALDAVIQTFNGINALRQHITEDARIHGIITHGGIKPNIVPDFAAASFYVRAPENDYRDELIEKLYNCAKGAALSTGAKLSLEIVGSSYDAMKCNQALGKAFIENLKELGEPIIPLKGKLGSTDTGNVSLVAPTIHPYIQIVGNSDIPGHSKEFAKAAISERGQKAMLNAAKALAMTAVDLFTNSELAKRVKEEFESS